MKRWQWAFNWAMMAAALLSAGVPKNNFSDLDAKSVALSEAYIPSGSMALEELPEGTLANQAAYSDFKARYGPGWSIFINPNNGRPSYIGGQGIPMIPGHGNALKPQEVFGYPSKRATVEEVDRLVRKFLAENNELFGLRDSDLTLMKESGFYGDHDYLCFLNYQISHCGVPIEGAIFQARLNHGNLVDLGIVGNYIEPIVSPLATRTAGQALFALEDHIGGLTLRDELIKPGDLKYVPVFLGGQMPMGKRIGHRLVWELEFTRDRAIGHWQAWVDAHSGKLLKFEDILFSATYRKIHGQVYPDHWEEGISLVDRPFTYVREDTGGQFTPVTGLYAYPGGDSTCSLNNAVHPDHSALIWIDELCGTKPALSSADGELDWGGTTEQDCYYTGDEFGNATEAALMALYHGTQVKLNALSYLPTNAWLPHTLRVAVNAEDTCNAFGGGDVTLLRSAPGTCHNFGLWPDILAHEIGHSLDRNDGIAPQEYGSGEVYGDTVAMLLTHESCIGHLAYLIDCVRQVDYLEKGEDPSTVQNAICPRCASSDYRDPCGREGHCTSEAMTETMWDLAARDLPSSSGVDAATAWERFSRLVYLSRPISGSMYECLTAPACGDWTSSGCASDNWYRTMRIVDDANGNLCDGTQNAAALWAAFNRHGIACPPPPSCPNENANQTPPICSTPAAPTLNAPTPQPCAIDLTWSPVADATEYKIWRSEYGADKSYQLVATVKGTVTAYRDAQVHPGMDYHYSVQGTWGIPPCTGHLSNVRSAAPLGCGNCVIPAAPSDVDWNTSGGQITVTWTDNGTGDGYRVYRRKVGEYSWTLISPDLGRVPSFTDAHALCGEDYWYRVLSIEASNGPCESAGGSVAGPANIPCCAVAPDPPVLDTPTEPCADITLTWTPVTAGDRAFNVYRHEGPCGSGAWTPIASALSGTTFIDTSARSGHLYAYIVRQSCDPFGATESSDSNCVGAQTHTPSKPEGLNITSTCSSVGLAWDGAPFVDSFTILRTSNSNCTDGFTELDTVHAISYTDGTAVAGETYYYTVRANNADCGDVVSDCFSGAIIGTPPAPLYSAVGCTSVTVSWDAVPGAQTYYLYRKEGTCGTGTLRAADLTVTTYTDATVLPGTQYSYYVEARNPCPHFAEGPCSSVTTEPSIGVTPAAPTYSRPTCNSVRINWTYVPNADSYDVYMKIGSCAPGEGWVRIASNLSGTFFDKGGLAPWNTYGFYVVAKNPCGTVQGVCSTHTSGPDTPAAPTFTNIGGSSLRVNWPSAPRASYYDLYRKSGPCGTGALIASDIYGNSYDDLGLACAANYSYYLVARNSCWDSDPGPCAEVATLNAVPVTPGEPSFSSITCTQARIEWPPDPDATAYDLRRKMGACDTAGLIAENLTTSYYLDPDLQEGTQYSYYVVARNACGYSANGACASLTTLTGPGVPASPHTTPFCDKITVGWTASTGANSYKVYRTDNADCATGLALVQTRTSTTWDDATASLGVTYHYKIQAHNNCGDSAYSLCVSGRRLDPPSQVTGLNASPTCPAVSLYWTDIANVTFTVYRTENPDCVTGWTAIGTTEDNGYNDATAVLGTTYYYQVSATDACGEGPRSSCVSGARMTAPTAPTAPTYTDVQCQRLTVNWAAVPTALSYDIYRIVGDCGTTTAYVTNWNQTSFTDTFLASNTKYSYYIVAKNSCFRSDPGPCSSVTTLDLPGNPSALIQTADCPTIALQWTGSAGASDYLVWRTFNADCTTNLGIVGTPTGTTFTDATANAGVTYYYTIQAYNVCGTSTGFSNCIAAVKGTVPAPPSSITPTAHCASIDLAWTAPPGAVSYNIWRAPSSNCSGGIVQIGTSGTASFSDTTAELGTLYSYRVQSANLCGTSNLSACSGGVERLTPPSPPDPPTFTTVTCDAITFTWNTVAGATGYDVYRRLDDCGTGDLLASGLTETSYTDEDLTQGTTYAYYVVSKNACGDSTPGACRTMVPGEPAVPAGLTATPNCGDVSLHWTAVAGAVSYEVWRSANADCINDFALIGTASSMPDFIDNTAAPGVTYRYVVKAVNACAISGGSACVSGARRSAPAKPANFTATGACLGNVLSWDPVPDTENYALYRGDTCGSPVVAYPGVTSPYTDTGALEGVTYTYWVIAGNMCGSGLASDCASAQRLTVPTPTISGPAMNTCPDLTVTLTTEAGQSDYQWYRSSAPIPGATASVYEAAESDVYTVSYRGSNGCVGTSGSRSIMVYVCGPPNIVYQSYSGLEQVTGGGDGDLILEAGEKWQVTVTVTNTGERHAYDVIGSLAGTGVFVCNAPGDFGDVNAGETGSFTFEFIPNPSVWYGTNACGNYQMFSLIDKSSNSGAYTYADDTDVISTPVGSPGSPVWEYANQANPLDAQDGIVISPLNPPLTGLGGDTVSASVTWMAFGDTDMTACAIVRLRAPDGISETVLKAAGQVDPMSADVLAFYRAHGPGTGPYTLVLEELPGCGGTGTAHIVAGTLSIQTSPGCSTGSASCGRAPEVSSGIAHPVKASRSGDNVNIQFEDMGVAHYQIYVSTSPATDPFADALPNGRVDCDFTGWASGPEGMMTLADYDLQGDIQGSPTALYFLITADNGPGSEGPLGFRTGGTERTAQAYCRR